MKKVTVGRFASGPPTTVEVTDDASVEAAFIQAGIAVGAGERCIDLSTTEVSMKTQAADGQRYILTTHHESGLLEAL